MVWFPGIKSNRYFVSAFYFSLFNYILIFSIQVLLDSKLPVDVLGCVWDLSDIDSDGFFDREEFSVV
jgi:hypothetical protein